MTQPRTSVLFTAKRTYEVRASRVSAAIKEDHAIHVIAEGFHIHAVLAQ